MDTVNTFVTAGCLLTNVAEVGEILSIVVTCVLIVYWLFVLGLKIYTVAKDGNVTQEELEELKEVATETEKQVDKLLDEVESKDD